MSPAIPQIQTYHCICTSLLLSTTHTLSSLPRRTTSTGGLDAALILPLPTSPPSISQFPPESETHSNGGEDPRGPDEEEEAQEEGAEEEHAEPQSRLQNQPQNITPLPQQGYTILLGLDADRKITLIRREDGFEKRLLHRCSRCRLVVGYTLFNPAEEIDSSQDHTDAMDLDGDGNTDIKGKGKAKAKAGSELEKDEKESYRGKVIYLLPGGVMSTDVMAKGGDLGGGRRIGEEDLGVKGADGGGVFE